MYGSGEDVGLERVWAWSPDKVDKGIKEKK